MNNPKMGGCQAAEDAVNGEKSTDRAACCRMIRMRDQSGALPTRRAQATLVPGPSPRGQQADRRNIQRATLATCLIPLRLASLTMATGRRPSPIPVPGGIPARLCQYDCIRITAPNGEPPPRNHPVPGHGPDSCGRRPVGPSRHPAAPADDAHPARIVRHGQPSHRTAEQDR